MATNLDDRIQPTARSASAWIAESGGSPPKSGSWLPLAGMAAAGFVAGVALLGARKLGMQMTTAVAGDWFRQLKAEHRLAEVLFEAGLRTKDHQTGRRTLILAHLAYALLKHGLQEETVIYPALRDANQNGAAKSLAAEHFDIKTYLHELSEMPKDDPKWIKVWNIFYRLVKDHIREEEEDIFPPFHEQQSAKRNAHLTRAMNREGIKLA